MTDAVDVIHNNIRLFSSIGIETASTCNRSCVFCPVSEHKRNDELMSWDMIKKIVQDLVDLNYKKRVELYIYNEPTRDKRLHEIIAYVRLRLPRACIMINTNGDYFKDREAIWSYFASGLNQMQINIYCAADGKQTDPEKLKKAHAVARNRFHLLQTWLDELSVEQDVSLYQYLPSFRQAAQVIRKFGDYADGIHHISNRSGNASYLPLLEEPLEKGCTKPFRFLNINWQGDSMICCNDFHGETNAMNVKESTLEEIWNCSEYHIYRLKLQNKDRNMFLCKGCDFDGGPYQHNIQHVTFGEVHDERYLKTDWTKRDTMFGRTPTTQGKEHAI